MVGIKNHGLKIDEFVFFLNDHWELDSDFHITILHDHIVRALTKSQQPKVLYIQGDNSAAESKNKYFIYFCALLVHLGLFDEVYYSTMIPGHTHEDIDQMFQAIHAFLTKNSALTFEDLLESVKAAYTNPPTTHIFQRAFGWKQWFIGFANPISGHKKLHCFCIKRPDAVAVKANKLSDLPRLFVKQFSTDDTWDGGLDGLGYILFKSAPVDRPLVKMPNYNKLPTMAHQKFNSFMNSSQKNLWSQLESTSGQSIIPQRSLQSIFDIPTSKPCLKVKTEAKQTSDLIKTKNNTDTEQEWVVKRILGERFNKKTHEVEYEVEWQAGDITFEVESQFYGVDGSENEAFTQYKSQKKKRPKNSKLPSKRSKKQ